MRVSFCITCMNRLHHLQQTLPANLAHNRGNNSQFVLLDYNSSDNLEQWVMSFMRAHIRSGRLLYARTTEPRFFHMAHAKNMSHRLSSGDVVCNLDADNYTGREFYGVVMEAFGSSAERILATREHSQHDCWGRIAVRSGFFHALRGYDESIKGYGGEDQDFVNRALAAGARRIGFAQRHCLSICHHDYERTANMEDKSDATSQRKRIDPVVNDARRYAVGKGVNHEGFGKGRLVVDFESEVVLS